MALDERIERELDRVARPADPSGVYEGLIRRRERLRMRRRVSAAAIAFAVFVGGAVGVYALSRTLGSEPRLAAAPMGGRIVLSTGTEADGSPSPQGWHLVSMNPDGSDRVDISPAGILSAEFPTVSPDGSRIAFAGFERRRHGLYVMQADGSDVERVLTLERDVDFIKALAWSPDGERIAILREVGSKVGAASGTAELDWSTTIWIVAPDGSDLHEVTTSGRETGVSWSPDSSRLAFSRHAPVDPGARTVASDVFTIDADGSNEVRLTTDGSSSSPAWSPDGATIAFDHSPPTGETHDLYLMDADGSNPRPLTSSGGNEHGAVWSPAGDALVFSELRADAARENSLAQVSVIRPDGSGYRVLTSSRIQPAANGLWWSVTPGSPTETPTGETSSRRSPTQVGPVALCETTSVTGIFASSASATDAVVGMLPRSDGTCGRPTAEDAIEGVAVIDLDGDGSFYVASDPFPCDGWCNAYAAPDVDGDGTDELLVQNIQFSVVGLILLDVVPKHDAPALLAAVVEPPGDPVMDFQGFDGSAPPQFWIGGDGFGSDGLRCEPSTEGRLLVSSSAQMDPPDSPEAVWKVHETTFRLESGVLTVVNVRDYEEPTGPDAPASFRETGGCGADLEPYA